MQPAASSGTVYVRQFAILGLVALAAGCASVRPGKPLARSGDEIIVAGQLFHAGTPVVLWMDPGGYDAYRVERHFAAPEVADWANTKKQVPAIESPNRYGNRNRILSPEKAARAQTNGWDLKMAQSVVDQFVLHYDASGLSSRCFRILHDERGLSVHFMLDVDGTIYQTLDLKERAWHATTSNSRSIGIEIANVGAFPPDKMDRLNEWYHPDPVTGLRLTPNGAPETLGIRTPGFVGHPDRTNFVSGEVQGHTLVQGDFTPEQYAALIKLTATLCHIFPKLKCDYPRDESGALITHKLADHSLTNYQGILGHYHVQTDKIDPGPALQWERLINAARKELYLTPVSKKAVENLAHP
ncbi:MAG TPA: N-acetylmuramoyl-L-alanine amidase [Candidatus Limnocylindria bacterium]|nr:N-acetylmuramoyl-L-alanine amidase [Candidatus Limnocylindria bacterium]